MPIPERLRGLPVAKQVHEVNMDERGFVCIADTGSGKTVVLPPLEASKSDRPILLRQPTRLTTTIVTSGMRQLWPDLRIALRTRFDKTDSLHDADLIIHSDGSMHGILAEGIKPAALYSDEAHWLSTAHEIELAKARKMGIPIRFLSATVDPAPFSDYLGGAPIHHLQGRVYPLEKRLVRLPNDHFFSRSDASSRHAVIGQSAQAALEAGKSIMWFLPTRRMCDLAATHFSQILPTTAAHGGRPPTELESWVAEHDGAPFAVFSTTAGATGITIGIDEGHAADEIVGSIMERGVRRMTNMPLGNNMLLQMLGRAARLRAGVGTVYTPPGRRPAGFDINAVKPAPVEFPCATTTPYEVVLQAAASGINDVSHLPLLSTLDQAEVGHAEGWLRRTRCVADDGSITHVGRSVLAVPLDTPFAHLVVTAPEVAKLPLLAASILYASGVYQMVEVKPGRDLERIRWREDFPIVPRETVVRNSVPLSLAALMARYAGTHESERDEYCKDNNLNPKPLFFALRDFREVADGLRIRGAVASLVKMDMHDPALRDATSTHVAGHPLFKRYNMRGPYASSGGSLDSVYADACALKESRKYWTCAAIPAIIPKRDGGTFKSLGFFHEIPFEVDDGR